MKKLSRFLALFMCLFCLSIALAACGGGDTDSDGKIDYTVTVTCTEGANPALTLMTVKVKLLNADGSDASSEVALTDGKATFRMDPGTYKVSLSGALTGYTYGETFLTATTPAATVEIKLDTGSSDTDTKVDYKIRVLKPDQTPMVNIGLQICLASDVSGSCYLDMTDDNGYAEFNLDAGTYVVHIPNKSDIPSGYTFDDNLYQVTPTDNEITVYLDTQTEYTVNVAYAKVKKDEHGNTVKDNLGNAEIERTPAADINVTLNRRVSPTNVVPGYASGKTDSTGAAKITTASSEYNVKVAAPNGYIYTENLIIETATPEIQIDLYKLGSDINARLKIKANVDTTVNITDDTHEYWYEFDCEGVPGEYKIESSGTLDTYAYRYVGNSASILDKDLNGTTDEHSSYTADKDGTDKNFVMHFPVHPSAYSEDNIYAFRIGAENLPEPVGNLSFTFKITFVEEIPYNTIPVTEPELGMLASIPQIPANSTFVLLEPADEIVYSPTDSMFHFGTESGPVIYTAVAGNKYFPRSMDKNFVDAYEEAGGTGFTLSDGETYRYNYGNFLTAYSEAANSDGLYPLTNAMKTFLQGYAVNNHLVELIDGWEYYTDPATKELNPKMYYFACGYYKATE